MSAFLHLCDPLKEKNTQKPPQKPTINFALRKVIIKERNSAVRALA